MADFDVTWRGGALTRQHALAPEEIERESERRLRARIADLPLPPWEEDELALALRMAYAAGNPELVRRIRISGGAVAGAFSALKAGADVVCDVRMVVAGLQASLLARLGCTVRVAIDDPAVVEVAKTSGLPRAVHAMGHLAQHIPGSIVLIGNAPTALLALLDLLDAGLTPPAVVIATPPGLVAAPEAKAELAARPIPHVTVLGTEGGSPLSAAALNALLRRSERGSALA
jgi:precorrin-8X/cobalt-precorrin-8 methylmutase